MPKRTVYSGAAGGKGRRAYGIRAEGRQGSLRHGKMRGPGDLFGIRQCGEMYFKLGDVFNDAEIMNSANEAVASLSDSELEETVQKMYDGGAKEVFQFFNNYVTI